MDPFDVTLRRLTVRDIRFTEDVLGSEHANLEASGLDPRTHALIRIGALATLDASAQSYVSCVEAARSHGASDEEIVGVIVAAMPVMGGARAVSAAPRLALALGYDLEAELEGTGALP